MPHHRPHVPGFLISYFRDRELNELYLSIALKTLAQSLIVIFVPIYFITLGYTLFDISFFYLIYFITVGLVVPIGMVLNSKIGIKKTLALGTFILIFYYYLLGFLDQGFSYKLIALVAGVSSAIYFAAFHIDFAKAANKGTEGKELSMLRIIIIIVGVLGPVTGSLLISNFSFNIIFKIVSGILFLSIMPLFYTKDIKAPYKGFSLKKIIKADTRGKAMAYNASSIIGIVGMYFWPLFIYLTLKSVVSLGVIISLSSLITIFIIAYIGRLTDRDKNNVFKLGVMLYAPSWLMRIFLLTPMGIFFVNFYATITGSLIDLPFYKMVYAKAKRSKNMANYFLFREYNLMTGRIFILGLSMITVSVFTLSMIQNIIILFIITFFSVFLYLAVLKNKWR